MPHSGSVRSVTPLPLARVFVVIFHPPYVRAVHQSASAISQKVIIARIDITPDPKRLGYGAMDTVISMPLLFSATTTAANIMSRALLINRAVGFHRPRQSSICLRSFSTRKPAKSNEQKRQERAQNFGAPGSVDYQERHASSSTKNKRSRPKKKGEGPPILIPPGREQPLASLPNFPFDRSHENDEAVVHHDMWTINASPFLDSKKYCERSAFFEDSPTRDGTLAARRLLQGKERMLETIQKDILKHTAAGNRRTKPKPYAMIGHGVPKQLLQSHVDFCDFLLRKYKNAAEISFKSLTPKLAFETMRVCPPGPNREPRLEPWSFEQYSEESYQMDLYLTVMNRFADDLRHVLWHGAPVPPLVENEEDDDFVRSSSSPSTLHHWNVDLLRGSSENPLDPFLTPIVEWTLPDNPSAPGRIAIRLCGQPTPSAAPTASKRRRRKAPLEVTMIFRATFENPWKDE